jgi:ABC-type branched-subunit amino acid transport system permease subunit
MRSVLILTLALAALLGAGPLMPSWLVFLLTVAFAKGLVVLGLLVMMRAGLVSFGQGLYYGLGAYTAGLATNFLGVTDAIALVVLGGLVSAVAGYVLGFIMARYRDIFFAMLSLALSMILYGILVRSAALGSTDGFNLPPPNFFGFAVDGQTGRLLIYALTIVMATGTAIVLHRFVNSPAGVIGEAILTNEIRVEYLGTSVTSVLHLTYVIGATTAGLGGSLIAIAAGHIDPDLAYWTTSGEFVFVAILSGIGHVAAPLLGMAVFEAIRSFAFQYSPYTWQMVVGISMLAVILLLPSGL